MYLYLLSTSDELLNESANKPACQLINPAAAL